MGYSTVIAYVIMFTLFLSTLYLLYDTYYDNLKETSLDSQTQTKRHRQQLLTEITLTSTSYSTDLILLAQNTGQTKLSTENMDLFVDRIWVEQENLNLTILNTSFDPGLWNPQETLRINATITLSPGAHEAKLVAENGVYAVKQFTTT